MNLHLAVMKVSTFVLVVLVVAVGCGSADETVSVSDAVRSELIAVRDADRGLTTEEYNAEVEEHRADCMLSEGFEYLPVLDSGGPRNSTALTMSEEEFIEEFGFGMLTRIEQEAFQRPPEDPNEAYYGELSDGERAAYDLALESCFDVATSEAGDPPGMVGVSPAGDEALDLIHERAITSAEYLEAAEQWPGCMASAGLQFENRDEMLSRLGQNTDRFAQPFIDKLNEFYATDDQDGAASLTMADALTASEYGEYQAAVDLEIEAAVADLDCGEAMTTAFDKAHERELNALIGVE